MSAHVIQLEPLSHATHADARAPLDVARTWLMVTIAGSVLAASLLIADASVVDHESRGEPGAAVPEPGPAPTLTAEGRTAGPPR